MPQSFVELALPSTVQSLLLSSCSPTCRQPHTERILQRSCRVVSVCLSFGPPHHHSETWIPRVVIPRHVSSPRTVRSLFLCLGPASHCQPSAVTLNTTVRHSTCVARSSAKPKRRSRCNASAFRCPHVCGLGHANVKVSLWFCIHKYSDNVGDTDSKHPHRD